MRKLLLLLICLLPTLLLVSGCGHFKKVRPYSNLSLIDSKPNGFAVFRSGRPDAESFNKWCELGITEVMVLSGNADRYEFMRREECPRIRVIYNEHQTHSQPATRKFLAEFDHWIETARTEGKKVLFRCNCGCHRTGRLAAYYEMKYMGRSAQDALVNFELLGRNLTSYPNLYAQIGALEDFIKGEPCRFDDQIEKRQLYCVKMD